MSGSSLSFEKQGVLLKRGRAQGFGFARPWDRRTVSLHRTSGELSFFEEKNGRLELRGQVSVVGGSARPVADDASGGKPWAFEVTFPSQASAGGGINSPPAQKGGTDKDLMFAGKSSAEREEWISAINMASTGGPPPSSKPDNIIPSSNVSTSAVSGLSQSSSPPRPAVPDLQPPLQLQDTAVKIRILGFDNGHSSFRRRLELLRVTQGFKRSPQAIPNFNATIAKLFPGKDASEAIEGFMGLQSPDLILGLRYIEKKLDMFDFGTKGLDLNAAGKAKLVADISSPGFLSTTSIDIEAPLDASHAALASIISKKISVPEQTLQEAISATMGPEFSVSSAAVRLVYQEMLACEHYISTLEDRLAFSEERLLTSEAERHAVPVLEPAAADTTAPFIPSLLGHCEQEFKKADEDCDGFLSRQEWRKWLFEKEKLIKNYNAEKADLLKENRNIKKAMSPMQQQALEAIEVAEARREAAERELALKVEENRKLLAELSAMMFPTSLAADVAPPPVAPPTPSHSNVRVAQPPPAQTPQALQPSRKHAVSVDFGSDGDDDLGDMVNGLQISEKFTGQVDQMQTPGVYRTEVREDNAWVRPLVLEAKPTPPSGSLDLLYSAPMSIAEHLILKRRSEGGIPEELISELRGPSEKLGRDTTMEVFSGIHGSKHSKHHDFPEPRRGMQSSSPERDAHSYSPRRSPSSPSRLSPTSRGGGGVVSHHQRPSPAQAGGHDGLRRGRSRPDYMAPTVVSQIKEKPQVFTPAGALRASSPWF